MKVSDLGNNNKIKFGKNMSGFISVHGSDNIVEVGDSLAESIFHIVVRGSNNVIDIGNIRKSTQTKINIGNHIHANNARVSIGGEFSGESGCEFFIYNSCTSLSIGYDCMFSRDIIIRTGESPHLIFDRNTGEYLDVSGNVLIGDHVWVGERAYLTKHACIPNECIVAASSVVTKKFLEEGSVIAGNPAKIVKSNIKWMRNKSFIDPNSVYHEKYYEYLNKLDN